MSEVSAGSGVDQEVGADAPNQQQEPGPVIPPTGCVALVCGGREYDDARRLDRALDRMHAHRPIRLLVTGAALGADALAEAWADRNRVPCLTYPADWKRHGRAAGPMRNQLMLDEVRPDVVVAFPGGRGTADMVARARRAGVFVMEALPLASDASRADPALAVDKGPQVPTSRSTPAQSQFSTPRPPEDGA